jgi:transposase
MGKRQSKSEKKAGRKRSVRKGKPVERIEIDRSELEAILERAKESLNDEEYEKIQSALETLFFLTRELEKKTVSVQRLKELLFGAPTEKTRKVLEKIREAVGKEKGAGGEGGTSGGKRKGHGRNGAKAYTGARKVKVPLEEFRAGTACPCCAKGKLYASVEPERIVRVKGRAPLSATVYELDRLRCGLCGEVFKAEPPEGVGKEKYDAGSASMIALLKYGMGMPFNRLAKMEGLLGIPLPASTQWEIVAKAAGEIGPAFEAMVRQAAQGEVIHNDDTTMKVLELSGAGTPEKPGRKGIFTSGIVSKFEEYKIAAFFTGRNHAGENLFELLRKRSEALSAPIQMCDALSRNMPEELDTIVSNCIAHARRKFVEVAENFPSECLHVLEILKEVYKNDAAARGLKMSPEDRLRFHDAESGPRMAELEAWMKERIDEKKVEPNSGLGEAIAYMRKHWNALTQFLRVPGAPLDNNVCERALKKAILHRKNALFYKTQNGARVGDIYMSFIHTCELNGANPFDYLTALQENATSVKSNPADWMPWNYNFAIESCAAPRDG